MRVYGGRQSQCVSIALLRVQEIVAIAALYNEHLDVELTTEDNQARLDLIFGADDGALNRCEFCVDLDTGELLGGDVGGIHRRLTHMDLIDAVRP